MIFLKTPWFYYMLIWLKNQKSCSKNLNQLLNGDEKQSGFFTNKP